MSRDYQRKINNRYKLPRAIYHQTLWIIRDYERIKRQLENILNCSNSNSDINSYIQTNRVGNPVLNEVIKRDKYFNYVKIIEESLNVIPTEYQKGVWDNVTKYKAYPLDADRSTYGRYKSKFIHEVAERFDLI
ncbi:hypothetical protein [Peptoniphilus genitalis]|uniref:hypothetical protein n=1 Tax=Peptoniphilus genitalis TaxID=3036303 RepID=UPI0024AD01C7|nr:hypothetical protein [Peptoniphilus sp. Marseille-Q7072]